MLVINFAQDLNIWKDILLPFILALIGLIPAAWIGVQSLKKQDNHFAQQIEMQRKIALFTERTKFKDKILEKIDEIYLIFFKFSENLYMLNNSQCMINHEAIIYRLLEMQDTDIADLVMQIADDMSEIQRLQEDDPKQYSRGKSTSLMHFTKDFQDKNNVILASIQREEGYQIYSLSNVYEDLRADFDNLSNMVKAGVDYLENISKVMNGGNFNDKTFQIVIKNVRDYYNKNLNVKDKIDREPEILKEIRIIKEKVQDTFIKNISLEL